jgi:asparagine synthase (glutamine-hydrolysing)
MCGIACALSLIGTGAAADARVLPGLDALANRGPDGRGVWASADRRVAIGHVRLAVRDLEGGTQPIATQDGGVVAAVNGELYETAGMRAELEARGHVFQARTDSEIVIHAWDAWGPDMLERLRGEFAFVLWDARQEVLFAARDRLGVKPLAWAEHQGVLLIASQVKALLAMGLRSAWDEEALHQCASLQYAGPAATLFAGARQVPAGHALSARRGRVAVHEYWDLDYPRSPPSDVDDEQAATRLGALLDDAVRVRLEADVPVAFQLSGGLDSSAVLAAAAHRAGRPLDAFTVSFTEGGRYDEEQQAIEVARHLGARLHVVRVGDLEVADSFAEAVVQGEGACINAHAAAKLRLSDALRASGFKVVLTGEGADEVLFGYAHLRGDLAGSPARLETTNGASTGLMLPDGEGICTRAIERALGSVPTWIAAKASFGLRVRGLARRDWLERMREHDAASALLAPFDVPGRLEGRGRVEQAAYLWTKLALEGYILRALGDGLEMAHGVEGRLPFLDGPLVDFVRALPTRTKIRAGVEKWVLRHAVRHRLPEQVVVREKHPFLGPPLGARVLEVARDVAASESFRAQPLLDPARVQALLAELPSMPADRRKAYDPVVYFALSIAALQARFGMQS